MRKHFNLYAPYRFELNDIIGCANVLNTILVIKYGLVASWFGVLLSVFCVIDDIFEVRKINLAVLHLSILALNIYFLLMLYNLV